MKRSINDEGKVHFDFHLPSDIAYELEYRARKKGILPRQLLETIVVNSLEATNGGDGHQSHSK